jgi:proton-translocating NADH-quinone oxidoreductase chain N
MNELNSQLPWVVFAAPAGAGVLIYLFGRRSSILRGTLAMIGAIVSLAIGILMSLQTYRGAVLTTWGNELRVDALSAFMTVVIAGIGLVATGYSLKYMKLQALLERVGMEATERRLGWFYALFMIFIGTMLWGVVTNNIIMLYVSVEATTIASGLLVAFYWDKRGLEASYKYLMLLTVGITFALFGCVLLYSASSVHLVGVNALLISNIKGVAGLFPRSIAIMAMAFLIVGFGTKAGIAPFHPWLPDAHAEAPTPVSALLSGVMLKMAAYALARTVTMFYPSFSPVTVFLVALGAFTMLLGIAMALVQDDLKRLLAYSSVSQMGYVIMGIGFGTYLGLYGALFHIINHAICKALLFMCVGAVIYASGSRQISQLGGLSRRMPITSACFFIGVLGISGMPPMNGFMSKITIFIAGAQAGYWWATIIAMFTGILTLVALSHAAWAVFWGHPTSNHKTDDAKEVPVAIWAGMVVLAALTILLGIYPQSIYPLLNAATNALGPLTH